MTQRTYTHVGVKRSDRELARRLAKLEGVRLSELLHRALSEYAASRYGTESDLEPTPGELSATMSRLQVSLERRLRAIEEVLSVRGLISGADDEKGRHEELHSE
jgi:hypothetical protein